MNDSRHDKPAPTADAVDAAISAYVTYGQPHWDKRATYADGNIRGPLTAALEAAAPAIRDQATAAERELMRQLLRARRDELADHSRQASALPEMSAMLAAQAAALGDFADLLDADQ